MCKPDILEADIIKSPPETTPRLSDEQLMICSHKIPGFSLANKRWCFFELDQIQEIQYNHAAFESLVLASPLKRMIHSIVKVQCQPGKSFQFDDIIKGKGKGMLMLLHGAPGTGKTLTVGQ